jgi:hypothetical protein
MFGIFKKKTDPVPALVQQAIGGQSVLFKLLTDILQVEPSRIRRAEVTHLTSAALSGALFASKKVPDPSRLSDAFLIELYRKSHPHMRDARPLKAVVGEMQEAFAEYQPMIMSAARASKEEPWLALVTRFCERTIGSGEQPPSFLIYPAAGLLKEFIADQLEFVKRKL